MKTIGDILASLLQSLMSHDKKSSQYDDLVIKKHSLLSSMLNKVVMLNTLLQYLGSWILIEPFN